MGYAYYRDAFETINFTQNYDETRSANALNSSYSDYYLKRLGTKFGRKYSSISTELIRENANLFESPAIYQKLLNSQSFRDEYISELKAEAFINKRKWIHERYLAESLNLGRLSLVLKIPDYSLLPNSFEGSDGRPYRKFRDLLIKARVLKERGLSFQDWANLEFDVYLKYCKLDPWCVPNKNQKEVTTPEFLAKNKTILGTYELEYFGLLESIKLIKKSILRRKERDEKRGRSK